MVFAASLLGAQQKKRDSVLIICASAYSAQKTHYQTKHHMQNITLIAHVIKTWIH